MAKARRPNAVRATPADTSLPNGRKRKVFLGSGCFTKAAAWEQFCCGLSIS